LGLLEHGDDLAVGKAGLLHGTSSGKGTRKFHFWRLLMGGGITAERARELMGSDDLDTRERGERLMSEAERQWREIPTMKDPPGLTKRLLCSVILIYGGTAFLWATAGWKIALGIFLVIWGIDLRLQVNEALTKRLRETLTW
ncbi:hypothetical protein AB5N79_23675, partial [Xanthomonas citri pv. citri]